MKNKLPDFSKKLIAVTMAGDKDGRGIDKPRWEMQGGRLFLVGTVARGSSTSDWCAGLVIAIAWDQVTDYLVFDSAAHYWKQLSIYERRKRKA